MTIRGTHVGGRILLGGFLSLAGLFAVIAWVVSAPTGSQEPVETIPAGSQEPVETIPAEIECEATLAEFGAAVACTAAGPVDSHIDWGDGTQTEVGAGFEGSHLFASIGDTVATVVAAEGELLAHATIEIVPDFEVECDLGMVLPVYATTPAAPGSAEPWDYVYLADETGERLYPGDEGYPDGVLAGSRMDKVAIGEAARVRSCRAKSDARDTFGGTATWTVSNEWYDDVVTRTRYLTPGTRGTFEGVQPIDVRIDLEVAGYEASERIGLYFGGCG